MSHTDHPTDPTEPTDHQPLAHPCVRVFEMVRHEDMTGFSGVGVVAYGMEFPDLSVAFRWRGPRASTVVFASMDDVIAVHGHGGATEIRWIASYGAVDEPYGPDQASGANEAGPTDGAGRLGTAWQRHDDLLWPPPDPNQPPPFPRP